MLGSNDVNAVADCNISAVADDNISAVADNIKLAMNT